MVASEEGLESVVVSGVAYDKGEAKVQLVGMPDRPGIVAKIFGLLAEQNVSVDMIIRARPAAAARPTSRSRSPRPI